MKYLLLLLFLTACPGRVIQPERFTDPRVAFQCDASIDVSRDILRPKCATSGCHSAASIAGDLDLETSGVALRLYDEPAAFCPGKTLLDPGNPFGGYFFDKVALDKPACGTPMPQTGPRLSQAELDCLHLYIALEIERVAAEQQR